MATSKRPDRSCSTPSTASSDDGCERSCASRKSGPASDAAAPTINAGQTLSSRPTDCSPSTQSKSQRDTPDEGNQRLESRVRENRTHGSEGGEANCFPDPYRQKGTPVRSLLRAV